MTAASKLAGHGAACADPPACTMAWLLHGGKYLQLRLNDYVCESAALQAEQAPSGTVCTRRLQKPASPSCP